MLKFLLLPAAMLAASATAEAQTQAPAVQQPSSQQAQQPQQQQQAKPALDPNRKICVTEDLIGSHVGGTRICKTAAQWEADRKRSGESD